VESKSKFVIVKWCRLLRRLRRSLDLGTRKMLIYSSLFRSCEKS